MTFKNMSKENATQGGSIKFKRIDQINPPLKDKEHNQLFLRATLK